MIRLFTHCCRVLATPNIKRLYFFKLITLHIRTYAYTCSNELFYQLLQCQNGHLKRISQVPAHFIPCPCISNYLLPSSTWAISLSNIIAVLHFTNDSASYGAYASQHCFQSFRNQRHAKCLLCKGWMDELYCWDRGWSWDTSWCVLPRSEEG